MHIKSQSLSKFFLLYLSLNFISTSSYTADSRVSEGHDKDELAATHKAVEAFYAAALRAGG